MAAKMNVKKCTVLLKEWMAAFTSTNPTQHDSTRAQHKSTRARNESTQVNKSKKVKEF